MHRRRLLSLLGTTGAICTAGCFSDSSRSCPTPDIENELEYEQRDTSVLFEPDSEGIRLISTPDHVEKLDAENLDPDIEQWVRETNFDSADVLGIQVGASEASSPLKVLGVGREDYARLHAYTCIRKDGTEDSWEPYATAIRIPYDERPHSDAVLTHWEETEKRSFEAFTHRGCPTPDIENELAYDQKEPQKVFGHDNGGIRLITSPDEALKLDAEELSPDYRDWVKTVTEPEDTAVLAIQIGSSGSSSPLRILGVEREDDGRIHVYTCIERQGRTDDLALHPRLLKVRIDDGSFGEAVLTHWAEYNEQTFRSDNAFPCPIPEIENELEYEQQRAPAVFDTDTDEIRLVTNSDELETLRQIYFTDATKEWVRETTFEETAILGIQVRSSESSSPLKVLGIGRDDDTLRAYTCIDPDDKSDERILYARLLRVPFDGQPPTNAELVHWEGDQKRSFE